MMAMRPLFSFHHVVGLIMLGYAAGVLATPNSGVTHWLAVNTFITPPLLAAAFAGCGTYILIARPRLALFSILTLPLLFYAVASVGFLLSSANLNPASTAVIAHNGLWLTINAALLEQARRGSPLPPPRGGSE